MKNLLLLIIFIVLGLFIYKQVVPTEDDLVNENKAESIAVSKVEIAKTTTLLKENQKTQENIRKECISMNKLAQGFYINAKDIATFSKDADKEISAIRLDSDVTSVGTLGTKRAKTLITQCKNSSKAFVKMGKASTVLAKMLRKLHKDKTYAFDAKNQQKYDTILYNLRASLNNCKLIEEKATKVSKIINSAYTQLARKQKNKNATIRYRQRSKAFKSKYGRNFYKSFRHSL